MPENSTAGACRWCGSNFEPRRDGGKAQRFCREACRRAFDAAGRRWVAEALAAGTVTIADLRGGSAATRALARAGKIPPETDRPVPTPPDPVLGALSASAPDDAPAPAPAEEAEELRRLAAGDRVGCGADPREEIVLTLRSGVNPRPSRSDVVRGPA